MVERDSTFTQHATQVLVEGKPQEAIQILDSWLRLNSDDAGAWEVVREAYAELGELSEAEHAARELVRLRPESAEAWCELGVMLSKQGRPEASQALHQALSINPGFERAEVELERVREQPTEQEKTLPAPTEIDGKHQPPPPPPHEKHQPPPRPPAKEPPTRPPVKKKQVEKQSARSRTETGWYGEPLGESRAEGWKIRSPEGKVYGPYTSAQLCEHLLEGSIGQEWGARFGNGRVGTVREALGAERCDELLRQRRDNEAEELASQQALATQAPKESTIRCPHCGQWTATEDRKSANNTRFAIILLGLLLWPVWLLLLVVKDKVQYRCASCGAEWTSKAV